MQGRGRIEWLADGLAPWLTLESDPSARELVPELLESSSPAPAGTVQPMLNIEVRGENREFAVLGSYAQFRRIAETDQGITANAFLESVTFTSKQQQSKPPALVEVLYLGAPCGSWPTDVALSDSPFPKGTLIHCGPHTFTLLPSDERLNATLKWGRTGRFTYHGPYKVQSSDFVRTLDTFTTALGVGLGSPIDILMLMTRTAQGRLLQATWQRPKKPHQFENGARVIGDEPERRGGVHLADWLTRIVDELAHTDLGQSLILLLRYVEQASSRPQIEMECLDYVVAIESLAGVGCQHLGLRVSHSEGIGQKVNKLQNKVRGRSPRFFHTDDVTLLSKIRNSLTHQGRALAVQGPPLNDARRMSLLAGWLLTVFHRLLAMLLDIKVPLRDLGVLGHPMRQSYQSVFEGPPVSESELTNVGTLLLTR